MNFNTKNRDKSIYIEFISVFTVKMINDKVRCALFRGSE